jgi:hypothetical protein
MAIKNYRHLSMQYTTKFTQIGIMGVKSYHIATLHLSSVLRKNRSTLGPCKLGPFVSMSHNCRLAQSTRFF